MRWRSARTAPGSPPAASTARRGCSTPRPAPSWPASTTTTRCTRWRSARTAPGWPPAASTARRGCSMPRRGPSWPASTTTVTVNTVAFSPDGTRVATGSDDRSARVFDAATGGRAGPPRPRPLRVCGGVQPGWHPGGHRQRRPFGAGVRCRDRRRAGPPRPRRPGARGGVQPGRHPGGHRQRRRIGAGVRCRDRGRAGPPRPRPPER